MTFPSAGDRAFLIPSGSGKGTATPVEAVAAGDRCVIMAAASGKPIVVKLNTIAAGNRVIIVPDISGKLVAINLSSGPSWVQQTAAAGWMGRWGLSAVRLSDNSIVLMGGYTSGGATHDVWRSTDNGVSWVQQTAAAGWSVRSGASVVALSDDTIIIMGGDNYGDDNGHSGRRCDVWKSTDKGVNWTLQTASTDWGYRAYMGCVVTSTDAIIITSGIGDGMDRYNDVWTSTNQGVSWTRTVEHGGWATRSQHCMVILPDGSLVIMGGDCTTIGLLNDVWRSINGGLTWTQMTEHAGWWDRRLFAAVALSNGNIIIMGGLDFSYNDVWVSTDNGANWTQDTTVVGWSGRYGFGCVRLLDNSIVVMGGSSTNDVWRYA